MRLQALLQTTMQISKNPHKKSKPWKNRNKMKEEELPYNKLKLAINQQKNTALGEDTIHPQMVKKLSPETLKYLIDMYNKIW